MKKEFNKEDCLPKSLTYDVSDYNPKSNAKMRNEKKHKKTCKKKKSKRKRK